MAASSRFRSLTFVLLTAAALAFAALTVLRSGADAASSQYKAPKVDQTRMLLRLPDLPPGYANGYPGEGRGEDGVLCAALTDPPDTPARLSEFVRAYRPKGCVSSYGSLFTPAGAEPRAPLVDSGAMVLGSTAAADAAWDLLPTLLSRVTKRHRMPAAAPAPVEVGTEAQLFHTSAVPFTYTKSGRSTSFLAWRSGNVVAVVMAISNSFATSDATVAELAPRQQAHILKPTPYTTAERFDGEVGLDDPAIDLPVYWLGRNFRPGEGLPPNHLFRSGFRAEPIPESSEGFIKEGPIAPLQVDYENIWLETWTPATWHVFANSATGRVVTTWKCTQTRTVPVAGGGSATIFGGYAQDFKRCPRRAPEVFNAWVDINGVKVVVNAPPAPDFIERVNPYGSFKGMEAILAALKLRPPPAY